MRAADAAVALGRGILPPLLQEVSGRRMLLLRQGGNIASSSGGGLRQADVADAPGREYCFLPAILIYTVNILYLQYKKTFTRKLYL